MSLISEALKAAEAERSGGAPGRTREAARQVLHGLAERRTPVAGATEWLYRPVRVPRHVQMAGTIVFAALVTSAVIVAFRPAPGTEVADQLALLSAPPALVDPRTAATLASDGGSVVEDGLPIGGTVDDNAGIPAERAVPRSAPPAGTSGGRNSGSPAQTSSTATIQDAGAGPSAAPEPRGAEAAPPPAPQGAPSAGDRRQLSSLELRVNASVRPNSELFTAAVQAQQRHDYAGAIALYLEILAKERDDVEVLNNLGVSYQALARYEEARDAFQRALAIQPRYPAAWSNLGVVLGLLGQDAEARTAFAEAIRQDPGNLGTKVNLALLHQRQNLPSEAKRLLQEVVAADAGLAEAHFALAGVYEAEGNVSSALRHYRLFIATSNSRFPQYEPLVAERISRLEGRR